MVKFNSIPNIAIWWKHKESQCGDFYGVCWLHGELSFPGERSTVVWKCQRDGFSENVHRRIKCIAFLGNTAYVQVLLESQHP